MDNGENFRTEELNVKTGEPESIRALNGKISTSLWVAQRSGFIDVRPTIVDRRLVQHGQPYGTFYAYVIDATPITKILGERKNLRRVSDPKQPEMYVIESDPEPDTPTLGWFCWKYFLDPQNGYLPSCIESYHTELRRLGTRIEILDYKKLPEGIAVPTKVKVTSFEHLASSKNFGQPTQVWEYTVDLEKSRWNCELDAGVFTVQFPPGVVVSDEIKARARKLLNPQLPQPRFIPRATDDQKEK